MDDDELECQIYDGSIPKSGGKRLSPNPSLSPSVFLRPQKKHRPADIQINHVHRRNNSYGGRGRRSHKASQSFPRSHHLKGNTQLVEHPTNYLVCTAPRSRSTECASCDITLKYMARKRRWASPACQFKNRCSHFNCLCYCNHIHHPILILS